MSLGADYFSSYASGTALREKNTPDHRYSSFSERADFSFRGREENEAAQDYPAESSFSSSVFRSQTQENAAINPSRTIPRPPALSLTLLVRSFALAASFVVITLIAVYWEDVPEIRNYIQSLIQNGGSELGGMVIAHQPAEDVENRASEEEVLPEMPSETEKSEKESEEIAQIRQLIQQNESGTLLQPSAASMSPLPENTAFHQTAAGTEFQTESQNDSLSEEMSQTLGLLGVQKGKLRRWGTDGEYWRYSCEALPQGETGGFSKYFEAVGRSPEEAAQAVIAKISDWQRAQNQALVMGKPK